MRRMGVFLAAMLLSLAVAGCSSRNVAQPPSFAGEAGKIKVATSFYPLYEFVQAVGGDRIDLINLVPPGVEPHDWEPTAAHLKSLNTAKLFVYNGAGLEHWVEKTLQSLDNKALITVETTHGLPLLSGGDAGDGHAEEGLDPHVWLDPTLAMRQVEAIRDGLIQADPAGRAVYEQNAAAYVAKLRQLDQEFAAALRPSECRRNTFFTSHAAFGYLARRYGLEEHAIMGLAPHAEPTAGDLARIVAEARAEGAQYIFFETLVSPKVSRLVADEIGAKTLVLNPFEGLTAEEVKAGKNYLTVMRENLLNLKMALECGR